MFKASSRSDSDAALNVAALKLGEENARRTLVSSSVLDSSLTALTQLLVDCSLVDYPYEFVFNKHIDPILVCACLSALVLSC